VKDKILMIEDNKYNLDMMSYLLKAFDYEPRVAMDGEEGLREAHRGPLDLILCDIQIPKTDGYGVARSIKNDAELKSVPLVAVTAFAMVGDRDKVMNAGFDGYIPKPINPETFIAQVEAFLKFEQRAAISAARDKTPAATAPERPKSGRRARILVVDNLPHKIYLLRSILEHSNYEVIEATNVDQALHLIRNSKVDLVVTDLHMPEKSGFDLVHALRADPQLRHIPILVHTATYMAEYDYAEAHRVSAEIIIKCPVDPMDLLKRIESCLRTRKEA
jgi:two-component system cell cycle response regulator